MYNMIGKLKSFKRPVKRSVITIVGCVLAFCLAAALAISPIGGIDKVMAATTPVAIDMINYGSNTSSVTAAIIAAHPEFLVDNSPAGPWKGDANISEYMAAGIKYFEYLDGGYEGTQARSIPNDLASNLNYITAVAKAGAYGIFLDEVSSNPNAASISYLSQIYNAAHALGLKVAINTGVDSWSDSLMNYCDYINSSEVWNNTALTASQTKWASRTWVLTQGVNDATTAANLTEEAWSKGLLAEYACSSYGTVPSWLPTYYSLISGSSPSPVTTAPSIITTILATGTVGTAYSQTLSATGGTSPYTWSIGSGTLPAGLTLSSTGTISGTPTATCTATPITFKVTDSNSTTATKSLAVTINAAPTGTAVTIATSSLSNGTVGTAYSQTLVATGGTAPYTWAITSGTLPSGLTLSSSGVIAGTPTISVDPSIVFKVTDNKGATASQSLSIAINSVAAVGGNTTGTVASTPVSSGGANEYDLYLKITSTTVSGITAGQQVWCAATTTDFPNLLTAGVSLTGNLSNAPGWWTFKAASASPTVVTPPTATAPTVATGTATSITSTGAVISGTLSSLGSASSVALSFNWGLTSSYGNTTAIQVMSSPNAFTATLASLTPATTYHFRAVATGNGTVYGSDITFTTGAAITPPVSTPPATGNTTGVVASVPVSSGAANEYDLYLKITSTTVSGVTVGQQVWLAASTTEYPNLLTVGSIISGNLSNSPGWWVIN
jgi:hypothetical protein